MTQYEAAHLRRGDQIQFVDGEVGTVQSILDGWVTIWWFEELITELAIDDFDGVERVGRYAAKDYNAAKAA